MQQLYFHPTWEKAISDQDRDIIEQLFEQTYNNVEDTIMSPTVRAAINHKGELLVTALVHNFTHHSARFEQRNIFVHGEHFSHEHVMTIPALVIAPFTSMPWTFICPPHEAYKEEHLDSIVLEIE